MSSSGDVLRTAVAPLIAPAAAVMKMQIFTAMKVVFMAKRWLKTGDELYGSTGGSGLLRCNFLQCC